MWTEKVWLMPKVPLPWKILAVLMALGWFFG
jgi:hypothetical protein